MAWPLSQDYNEAIQDPQACFADPELQGGEAATNPLGLPRPRSGNFADVYEVHCPATKNKWAVKCFTREVPGLRERYHEISRALKELKLPFAVDFQYLVQGIQVDGDWFPILKMRWVEGLLLNEFVRDHLGQPALLGQLGLVWGRMGKWLQNISVAHCDLQHGNVLLVPGATAASLAVKLIDYDGMFVPTLAKKISDERGHANYQHPQRLREGSWNAQLDRFPLLVVATALRALSVGGKGLWERYNNGDNLLFKETDLRAPGQSALFKELLGLPDPQARKFVQELGKACAGKLEAVPTLDELLPEGKPTTARVPAQVPKAAKATATATSMHQPASDFADLSQSVPTRRRAGKLSGFPLWGWLAGGAVAFVLSISVLLVALLSGGKVAEQATLADPKDKLENHPKKLIEKDGKDGGKGKDSGKVSKDKRPDSLKPDPKPIDKPLKPEPVELNSDLRRAYKNRSGEWRIEGDELVQESLVADCLLVFGDFTWKDYDFSCKVKKVKGQYEVGLLYHVTGAGFGQFYRGGGGNNSVDFVSSGSGHNRSILKRAPGVLKTDQWYKLTVRLRGEHCECFVDDQQILNYEEKSNLRGAIGLATALTSARFREIRVTDPTGKVLFEGLPKLPATGGHWPPPTELASSNELHCLKGHGCAVTCVSFSRDGRQILSLSSGDTVHAPPEGGRYFFDSPASTIRLWDGEAGKELDCSSILNPVWDNRAFTKLALNPQTNGFLTTQRVTNWGPENKIQFWTSTAEKIQGPFVFREFPEKNPGIVDLSFSTDGSRAQALGFDGSFWEWNLGDKKLVRQFRGDLKGVSCGRFAPNGRFAILARGKEPFTEIDLVTGKETGRWKQGTVPVNSMAFTPDSSWLITGHVGGEVRIWNLAIGEVIHTFAHSPRGFQGHNGPVLALAVSPDGKRALSGGQDGTVRLWDLYDKKELACFTGHTGPVRTVAFSLDGRRAASGSEDYTVRLWRLPPPNQASPIVLEKADDKDFVSLFNGKDFVGWKTHPSQSGNWRVENAVLIGSGPAPSDLYSERDDFKDFHLRIKARINDQGIGGVYFRKPFDAKMSVGYNVQINCSHKIDLHRTGSLYAGGDDPVVSVRQSLVPQQEWFTLEILAQGNRIVTKVNGKTTTNYTDEKRLFTKGHIVLQRLIPQGVVEFSKIEIKELPPATPAPEKPKVTVILAITPADAEILIDGVKHLGTRNKKGERKIEVEEGDRQLTVTKKGFTSFTRQFTWMAGKEVLPIKVALFESRPFRVPMNGLAGKQFLDPMSFGPDWIGFNGKGDPQAWMVKGAFAKLATKAGLGYPSLPVSWYVFETELEILNRDAGLRLCLGHPWSATHFNLFWHKERQKVEGLLTMWRYWHWNWWGNRDFDVGQRLQFKLLVADGRQALFLGEKHILTNDAWPEDLAFRIWSETPNSALLHRCSFRELTEEDLSTLKWVMPRKELALNPAATKARLDKVKAGLAVRPQKDRAFVASTTATPLTWIPPGEFDRGFVKEKNRHRVRLTQGFWMGQYEITQKEWLTLMRGNASRITGSPYLPVDWVSWEEAMRFCYKLTEAERKLGRVPTGYEYRLPTEAEWEYACRAGSDEDFSVELENVWSNERSDWRPHEVGEKSANRWGLYDMHGNVMEWCADAWSDYPKKMETLENPFRPGKVESDAFVVRGGAWWTRADACRSSWRNRSHSFGGAYRGFRVVLAPVLKRS